MSEAVSAASAFDAAVAAVRAGADPAGEAGKLYEELTEAERLGLLDGDVPFWEGLAEMRQARYGSRPYVHGAVARLGIPGTRFVDGPRGCVAGHGTAFPVSMARGATWDVDLEERVGDVIGRGDPRPGRQLLRRGVHQPAPPPGLGPGPGDLRRRPAPPRGVRGRADPRAPSAGSWPAPSTTRSTPWRTPASVVDVTRRRRRPCTTSTCRTSSGWRRGCGGDHGGVQLGQRRVVRAEHLPADARCCATCGHWDGITVTDFIFGLRDAAASLNAGMDLEEPFAPAAGPAPAGPDRRGRDVLGHGRAGRGPADRGAAALVRRPDRDGSARRRGHGQCARHRALARDRGGPGHGAAEERPGGRRDRCCRSTRIPCARSP